MSPGGERARLECGGGGADLIDVIDIPSLRMDFCPTTYFLTAESGAINAPLGDGGRMGSILRQAAELPLLVTRAAARPLFGRVRAREHHLCVVSLLCPSVQQSSSLSHCLNPARARQQRCQTFVQKSLLDRKNTFFSLLSSLVVVFFEAGNITSVAGHHRAGRDVVQLWRLLHRSRRRVILNLLLDVMMKSTTTRRPARDLCRSRAGHDQKQHHHHQQKEKIKTKGATRRVLLCWTPCVVYPSLSLQSTESTGRPGRTRRT